MLPDLIIKVTRIIEARWSYTWAGIVYWSNRRLLCGWWYPRCPEVPLQGAVISRPTRELRLHWRFWFIASLRLFFCMEETDQMCALILDSERNGYHSEASKDIECIQPAHKATRTSVTSTHSLAWDCFSHNDVHVLGAYRLCVSPSVGFGWYGGQRG